MIRLPGQSMLLQVPARKTSPPEVSPRNVRRQRLMDRLHHSDHTLTLIQGAAGCGKTIVAAQWARELAQPIVWVSLDSTDNDPMMLISTMMDALFRAGLDGQWNAATLTSDEPTYSREIVPHLQIRLTAQQTSFTLVLDDVHEVTSPRAVSLLRSALECLPHGSHGIVAGRVLQNLPIAAWLSSGRAILLPEAILAMDASEVANLLTTLGGVSPEHTAVRDLLAATNGWPIAVYLGAGLVDPTRLGDLRYFSAFLDEEVLNGADAQTIWLLRATSGLIDLSAELCDFVLQRTGSADLLARAERASLLVTRSADRAWYRLHPLLREHLHAQLLVSDPGAAKDVAQRASRWSLTKGYTDRAITYATESKDMELLATTVWECASKALTTGQAQRVVDWLAAIDDATIASFCPLALSAAWCAVNRGQPADAYRWSQAAFAAADDGWESNLDRSTLEAGLALLLSTTGSLGYGDSAVLAGRAMRSLPHDHVARPYAQMITGWMHALDGSWDQGQENLHRSAQLANSLGLLGTEVEAKALLSMVLLTRGDFHRGEPLVREALCAWERGGISHFLSTEAMIAGPAALVAARSGQRDLAASQLAQVEQSLRMFGPILPWLVAILESFTAWAYALLGDQQRAGQHLVAAANASAETESPLLAMLLANTKVAVEGEFLLSALSPAERRVFEQLLTRRTLREIADSLFVSPETVKTQTGSVYRKLGLSSRRELHELGDRFRGQPGDQVR